MIRTDPESAMATLRLFCLAHAGGSTAHFRTWKWLAPYAEIVPVELPGHGSRMDRPPISDWDELAEELTATVDAAVGIDPQSPYALFGHSLGSLLAFDITHRMTARGRPPDLLVVAGRNGPSATPAWPPVHALPDTALISALRELGGVPDALLQSPELLALFLPIIRADMRLAELYERPALPSLSVPVLALAGRDDPMTDDAGMLAWKGETTGPCEVVFLDGGHFFLASPEFAGVLTERLARPTPPTGG